MKTSQGIYVLVTCFTLVMSATVDTCKKVVESTGICTHTATAKDFTGMDGCRILLVLDSGIKLLAVNLDDYSPPLRDGEKVRISFEKTEDMVSICMAEDTIVRLTCLARQSGPDWVVECPGMVDPYRIEWSARVMQEINPRQVEELVIDGRRAYRFYALSGVWIYSCSGELLCTYSYNTTGACDAIQKKATDVKIIYVVNE